MLEENPHFWVAVIGAVTIKALMSKEITFMNVIVTFIAGVYSGWAFTDFFLELFRLERTRENIILTAAIVAITGENLLRQIIIFSRSENMLAEIWKLWRGKR